MEDPHQRPGTSASIATLRPMPRVVSVGTTQYQSVRRRGFSVSSVPDAEVTDRLFSNLKFISTALRDPQSHTADLSQFMELIQDSSHLGSILIHRFQQGLDELVLEQLHADKLYTKLDKMAEKLQMDLMQPRKTKKAGKDVTPSIVSATSRISRMSLLDGGINSGATSFVGSSPLRNISVNVMPESPTSRRKLTWPSWMKSFISTGSGKPEITEENIWLTYDQVEETKPKREPHEERSTRGRSFSHSRFPRLSRSKIWRKDKEKDKDKPRNPDSGDQYVVGSMSSRISSAAASTYELPTTKNLRAAASSPSLCSSSLSSVGTNMLEPMTPEEKFAPLPLIGLTSYVAFPSLGTVNGQREDGERDAADLAGLHVIDHVKADMCALNELMSGVRGDIYLG